MQKTTIGVDRIEINQFEVIDIDLDKMSDAKRDKRVAMSRDTPIITESGKKMPEMTIHDNNRFIDLMLRIFEVPGTNISIFYTRLVITVRNIYGCNANNISLSRYRKEMEVLVGYIYDTYGVLLSFGKAQIRKMEINCTFPIKRIFAEYARVLRVFMVYIPDIYKFKKKDVVKNPKKGLLGEKGCKDETFRRKNDRMELIIYDKKTQLEEYGCKCNECMERETCNVKDLNLMRIELRVTDPKKIDEIFGTKKIADITDEQVVTFFFNQMQKMIVKPYEEWRKQNLEELSQDILQYRGKSNQWQYVILEVSRNVEMIDDIPRLLDIEDLLDALPKDKYNHKSRVKKGFQKKKVGHDVFFQGDAQKAPEIFGEIGKAFYASLPDRNNAI